MIITFNPDSQGGNGTTMGFNMRGNHAAFVLDGIRRPRGQVYWNINARCWLFTKDFFNTGSIIYQDDVFPFFPIF
jgi:hypothetical protein